MTARQSEKAFIRSKRSSDLRAPGNDRGGKRGAVSLNAEMHLHGGGMQWRCFDE